MKEMIEMKRVKGLYLIEIILFIFIIISNLVVKGETQTLVMALLFLIMSIFMGFKYGIMRDNNYSKGNVVRVVIATLMSFLLIQFFFGFFMGFSRNALHITLSDISRFLVVYAVLYISQEIIRYIIARTAQKNKKPLVLYTIILIVLDIIMQINGFDLHSREMVFIFICVCIVPAIARQTLCSYLTYKVSYLPGILYRVLPLFYASFSPIIPDVGNYFNSVIHVLMPYTVYHFSRRTINYKEKGELYSKRASRWIVMVPVIILAVVMVSLIMGVFKHKILAIGSNSMAPSFYRGDAVIYEKIEPKKLKNGEVIAFARRGIVVTHRVHSIKKNGDRVVIETKGDANNGPDKEKVTNQEVLGKVKYVVKYIGFPTIWVREVVE